MIAIAQRTALLAGALAAAAMAFTSCSGSGEGSDASSGEAGDLEAFCALYDEFDNTDDLGDDTDALVKSLEDLDALAPSELKNDFDIAIDAFKTLSAFNDQFEAGEDVDNDDPELINASLQLDESGENIDDYVLANRGLES